METPPGPPLECDAARESCGARSGDDSPELGDSSPPPHAVVFVGAPPAPLLIDAARLGFRELPQFVRADREGDAANRNVELPRGVVPRSYDCDEHRSLPREPVREGGWSPRLSGPSVLGRARSELEKGARMLSMVLCGVCGRMW